MNEVSGSNANPPNLVVCAAALVVLSAILAVMRFAIDYDLIVQSGYEVEAIVVFAISLGSMLFFAYMALKGRNWARVVFLIVVSIGLLPALAVVGEELRRNAFLGFFILTQAICQVAAIVMFFLPKSNDWYREIKATRQA